MTTPTCVHCTATPALVTGAAIYPHRPDLADKPIWLCACGARVGCHPGTTVPLGRAADAQLRGARGHVHALLDPIWRDAWKGSAYRGANGRFDGARGSKRIITGVARTRVYEFLASRMGLTEDDCHVGMFDLEQCRQAYAILRGRHYAEIRSWAKARRPVGAEEAA